MKALIALPAWAQTRDENLAQCAGGDPDASISGCTALLQSGRGIGAAQTPSILDRGLAYAKKGLYDQAIWRPERRRSTLVPTNAYAYNDRATAYIREGRRDQAMLPTIAVALVLDPTLQAARVTPWRNWAFALAQPAQGAVVQSGRTGRRCSVGTYRRDIAGRVCRH